MSEMTATRTRPTLLTAALVLGWCVGAALLWQSAASGPAPEELDPAALFDARTLDRNARYEYGHAALWALGLIAQLAALALLARRRPDAAGPRAVRGALLGGLVYAVAWLADLPFDLAGHWWRRRYGVSELGYAGFVAGPWSTTLGELGLAALAGAVVVVVGARLRRRAWVALWVGFCVLAVAYVLAYPTLLAPRLQPLDDRALAAEIQAIARDAGLGRTEVEVRKAAERTRAVNAEAIGAGPTTRVVLWDTLLARDVDRGEIRFAAAHELAHVARDHLWKGVAWFVLLALPCVWVLARLVPLGEPRALPAVGLALLLLQLALLPAANAITRRYEREADAVGLRLTQEPAAAEALYRRFARTGLTDPDPPLLLHVLLDTHPTLVERIAAARAAR
jgi:STE24 endopeptidase